MQDVTESLRLPSPAPRPQSLAFDGEKLWMGSVETSRLYAIDPVHWTVLEEDNSAPGLPWGMTVIGDELRVVCGEGDDDDRFIHRFVPGHGFKSHALECPDKTGSQLSYDGTWLYLSQWYNKCILGLDEHGDIVRRIDVPRGICAQCFVDGAFYVITTDDEASNEYFLGKISMNGSEKFEDIARVPFAARALAFDGTRFWTNHREANEIVSFTA